VEKKTYCFDILTQVGAVTKALESVALGLLDDHLGHCVVAAASEGRPVWESKLKEASDSIACLCPPAATPESNTPRNREHPASDRMRQENQHENAVSAHVSQ
jgi:DNA-binding FrmR family transcriptional regulator